MDKYFYTLPRQPTNQLTQNIIQGIYRDLYVKKILIFHLEQLELPQERCIIQREFPKLSYNIVDQHSLRVSFMPKVDNFHTTSSYLIKLVYKNLFKYRFIEEKIQTFGSTMDTISIMHDITSTFPNLVCTYCEYENYTKFRIRFDRDPLLESLILTTLEDLQKELKSYDQFNPKKAHQLFQKNLYIDNGTLSKRKKLKTYYIFGNRCIYYKRKNVICKDKDCEHTNFNCPIPSIHLDDHNEREMSVCEAICGFLTGEIIIAPCYIRPNLNKFVRNESDRTYYCVDPKVNIVQERYLSPEATSVASKERRLSPEATSVASNERYLSFRATLVASKERRLLEFHQTIHEFILGRSGQHFQDSNRYKIYSSTIMTRKELAVVKYAQNRDHLLALFKLDEIVIDIRRYIMHFLVLL